MADNIQTPTGSGSDPAVATDDIGGAHFQKIKIALGAENEFDTLVDAGQQTMANSIPVVVAANQSPIAVDATPASPAANDYLPVRLTDGAGFYSGGGGQTDKSAFAEGSGRVTPIAGIVNDTPSADPAEDQAAAARITPKRALHVNLRSAAGTETGVAAAPVRIDPVGTTAQPVSNAGSFAVQDSEKLTDNAAFGDGTSKVMLAGYVFDETAGTALSENDAAAARLNANRAQVLVIEDDATRGRRAGVTAANALKVDGSAVTQPVSGTVTANAGSGTFGTQDSASQVDNGTFSDGASRVIPAGFYFDETAGTALSENDIAAARIDAKRALVGVVEDGTNRGTRLAVKAASVAPLAADPAAVVTLSPNGYHRLATYAAVYRLGTRPYALSNAFAANTRKQFATLHHGGTATKTVRIRRIQIALESSSAAAIVVAELVFITGAPATGNPIIAPTPMNRGDATAEATALALPTTGGTEPGLVVNAIEYNLGVTGAASTANPPPAVEWIDLYDSDGIAGDDGAKALVPRAGQLEGIAVVLDCNAASTVKGFVRIVFTEE
jgi:hypothetical protein